MTLLAHPTPPSAPPPAPDRIDYYAALVRRLLNSQAPALLLLGVLFGIAVLVAFLTKNTFDTGDSIAHYQYARYVPQHPLHLLHSWAKPLFTLLAAGPSQFGFIGIKLFQCVLVAASAWLAYRIACILQLPWPALAMVFCYASPDYFRIQYSGLTEPLFGLILVASVYLAFNNRPAWSAFLMSWLPFVRSEGVLLWGLWGIYLLWNGSWRTLPLLATGYVVYSLIGGLVLHNFAWLFTDNPYALHSPYGSGHWRHFLDHVPTLLGWPIALMGLAGGLYTLRRAFRLAEWKQRLFRAEFLLIYGSIALFTTVHSVLWAYGLFGSFGMTRVLTVLTPLCAIAALTGLAWLAGLSANPVRRRQIRTAATASVVIMLFAHDHGYQLNSGGLIGHESNLHWRRDFREPSEFILADRATDWLRKYDPHWAWHPIAFEQFYYPMALGVDMFDPNVRARLNRDYAPYLDGVPVGTYIFWEDWFAPVEGRITLDMLQNDPRFKQLWHDSLDQNPESPMGWERRSYIFIKIK